ncbi:hypothetical protein RN001_006092 [Aquatica leii]|uniref:Uncharacterized protein n=1 Tax=Aquatica leii TaxID=1421715 RepID=A0AAN7PDL8_9COLE|nr:hypothetical protein RN001_006092 [Aquatica leii]
MDQQLSTLRIQRGYFKTTLTNFKKHLEKININDLNDITIAQLETRLLKIEPLIDEFNKVHLQIKTLDNNDSEELEGDPELEIFENSYFDSIAKVKCIILNARKSDKCSADVSLVTNNSLTQQKEVLSKSSNKNNTVNVVNTVCKSVSDSHAKYFKDALINKKLIDSYTDLGSSCITMREDKVEEFSYSYFECDSNPLIGYGQGVLKLLGLFTALLNIDGVEAKLKVHVMPNESQDVSLIVSHPFTAQEHVLIISRADKLEILEN